MSLVTKLGLDQHQFGGYIRGQKSSTDEKGNRVFIVYTHTGDEKYPLYKDNDEELKEMKFFKGKTPQTVAKKVVTEICQMIRKSDPAGYKKFCRAVTESDIKKREKELTGIKDDKNIDKYINWSHYPGFRFELRDTMNSTSDGVPRTYLYYGERAKLDHPKKYNGNRFSYEPQVVPIRRDYTLGQALVDHLNKSEKAAKRERKNQNFAKYRTKRSLSRSRSRKNTVKTRILEMSVTEISRRCHKGTKSWKISELNNILTGLGLSKTGNKEDKCKRILAYYKKYKK